IYIESKNMIATSPNGNSDGVLNTLENRGIRYAHCYSVDNISIKIRDAIIIGHALKASVEVTAKAIPKSVANEPLWVIYRLGVKIHIVEYSKMDP
ncbi:UDP-N-acetylglucosamine pyrophosphorylase, partial [Dissophora ornata]